VATCGAASNGMQRIQAAQWWLHGVTGTHDGPAQH
jgi:hypothetical protein